MRKLILLIFLSAVFLSVQAQSDSITATKAFGGYRFEQNGQYLNGKTLLQRMATDQEAYGMMKRAKNNSDIAAVLGFAGGLMIGWPLGTAIAGGNPNWVLAGVGAGCLAIGIPLSISASRGMFRSVEIYNSNLNGTYFEQGLFLKLGLTSGGVGVTLDF